MLNGQALSSSADDAQELELTVVANGDEYDDMDAHRAPPGMVAGAHDEGAAPEADGQTAAEPPAGALPVGRPAAPSGGLHAGKEAPKPG